MPTKKFEQGHDKKGGRQKGTQNKRTIILDTFAKSVCDGGMDKFMTELKKLTGKDYVYAYLSIFEYVKPKLSRMEMQAEVEATIKKVGYGKEE